MANKHGENNASAQISAGWPIRHFGLACTVFLGIMELRAALVACVIKFERTRITSLTLGSLGSDLIEETRRPSIVLQPQLPFPHCNCPEAKQMRIAIVLATLVRPANRHISQPNYRLNEDTGV
jgi:hypothetical protein